MIPGYVGGNWGYFYLYWDGDYALNKAYMGIATDVTTQESRNHLILEEFTQSLRLMNIWRFPNDRHGGIRSPGNFGRPDSGYFTASSLMGQAAAGFSFKQNLYRGARARRCVVGFLISINFICKNLFT